MFNTAQEAIDYIEQQRTKRTFTQFQETVQTHHFPTRLPFTIHVAGTNGKGSTVQYIKEILMAHGYRVGTFTSPYMECHNDRICINGQPIDDEQLVGYSNQLYPIIKKEQLSMFEIDVLIMVLYFSQQPLDFCIIETGIGGQQDKTNVLTSDISVITNIGKDHQEMLGRTHTEIAKQKAGIIKKKQICITGEQKTNILSIFSDICQSLDTELEVIKSEEGYQFTYQNVTYTLPRVGSYQVYNAKVAVAVAKRCAPLNIEKTRKAIKQCQHIGRFENIGNIYLDGAHNPDGIRALVQTIHTLSLPNVVIVFCVLADKEQEAMVQLLKEYPVVYASFSDDRVISKAPHFTQVLVEVEKKYDTIVCTGSLHFVSTVRKYIKRSTYDI